MKCVVFQNAEGEHLGFMLCSVDLSEASGDCVFVVVPGDAALCDSAEANLLLDRKAAGESTWHVDSRSPLLVIVSTPDIPGEMFIEFSESGMGQWGINEGPQRQVLGQAMLPPS